MIRRSSIGIASVAIGIASVAILAFGTCVLAGPQQPAGKGPAGDRLVRRVYPVPDLIKPDETMKDRLIEVIKLAMGPEGWADAGGQGTVQYFPMGKALVVCQTEEVHRRISLLLNAFRKSRIPWYELA